MRSNVAGGGDAVARKAVEQEEAAGWHAVACEPTVQEEKTRSHAQQWGRRTSCWTYLGRPPPAAYSAATRPAAP